MFFVYFLKSIKNGKIYVGYTSKNIQQRLNEHNLGSNAWTLQNGPFVLLYYEIYLCKKDAEFREKFYKSGFGRKIRNAIIDSVSASCQRQMSLWLKRRTRLWRGLERLHGMEEVKGSAPEAHQPLAETPLGSTREQLGDKLFFVISGF